MKKTASVIVCAYNEENTVFQVLEKLRSITFVNQIVVVDNGSTDKTRERIQDALKLDSRIELVIVEKNKGLGFGFRQGIAKTTGDVVLRQDADLEYDPDELINLYEQIDNGHADVVYGSRMLVRKAHRVHYYYSYLANIYITMLSNFFTNLFLSDVETASKAFNGKMLRELKLTSKGFEIENELTIKFKHLNCSFYEVPISYYGRKFSEGKKIRVRDGFWAVYYIFYFSLFCAFDSFAKGSD
jgi:glycosyltransferase involved in cell wall biosynthesis